MPRSLRALAAALLLGTGACSLTFDATNLGVPATLASDASAPAEGTPFSVSSHAVYGFWGVLTLSRPSVQKVLAGQLVGGRSVADVRIKVRSSFTDVLLTVITAGVVVPRTVTVEGTVVGQ